MFRVHAKFMMQGLYVLYMLSTDLRGSLNGARSVERRVKETCSWLLSFFFWECGGGTLILNHTRSQGGNLILQIINYWISRPLKCKKSHQCLQNLRQ